MCPPSEIRQHAGGAAPPTSTSTAIPDCVPPDPRSQSAYTLAREKLPLDLLNHSVRVYLNAKWHAERDSSPWSAPERLPLLFVACMLHDIGCASDFDGPLRFEVEGAEAAAKHLRQSSTATDDADIHDVWQSIALHTSPHIAERISPLTALVRRGVVMDFSQPTEADVEEAKKRGEAMFPRLAIEKVLSDTVVEQGLKQREKALPGTWVGMLVKSKEENPEWEGVNKGFVG